MYARDEALIATPIGRVRVSSDDRALGHYSGGEGPRTKIWLLDHERAHVENRR